MSSRWSLVSGFPGAPIALYLPTENTSTLMPAALMAVVTSARAKGVPLRVIAVGSCPSVAGADMTLADTEGHFRQRYGVQASGAGYLLRPDQHVCARWLTLDATRLQDALTAAMPQ